MGGIELRIQSKHWLDSATILRSGEDFDMASLDFRKINIDQYDEDQLLEDELYEADPRDPATVLADAKSKAAAVRGLIAKWVIYHQDIVICEKKLILRLTRADLGGALNSVLENAPYGPKVDDAKVRFVLNTQVIILDRHIKLLTDISSQILTLQTLLLILNSTKPAEIPTRVKALSSDHQDTLMKYLYKAMAMPGYADVNSSALLSWHEKVRLNLTFTYRNILLTFSRS
jgi:actin related protein 2/3 complex, subunit 5